MTSATNLNAMFSRANSFKSTNCWLGKNRVYP
jgi:hypothetical protein